MSEFPGDADPSEDSGSEERTYEPPPDAVDLNEEESLEEEPPLWFLFVVVVVFLTGIYFFGNYFFLGYVLVWSFIFVIYSLRKLYLHVHVARSESADKHTKTLVVSSIVFLIVLAALTSEVSG